MSREFKTHLAIGKFHSLTPTVACGMSIGASYTVDDPVKVTCKRCIDIVGWSNETYWTTFFRSDKDICSSGTSRIPRYGRLRYLLLLLTRLRIL